MKAVMRRVGDLASSLGWAGGLGAALLASALLLGLAFLPPAQEEHDALSIELHKLRKLAAQASPERPAMNLRRQLDAFLVSLPRHDQVNAHLAQLHELAARNGLTLKNGEYRPATGKGGPIGRLQVTVRTDGTYTDLRRFLRDLSAVLPAVAVSRISMRRQRTADAALETNMEFAFFYTGPGT